MPSSSFIRHLKKHLQLIRRLAGQMADDPRKGAVHQLRLALKRWRAHLRLLQAVDPAFPYPEVYAPFKKLFAQAGQLRFWQLQAGFLRRWEAPQAAFHRGYGIYLRKRYRAARKKLQAAATGRLPRWRDLKHEFHQSAASCTPAAVLGYFEVLQHTVADLQRQPSRRRCAELHELRKILKEYASNRRLATQHLHLDPGPASDALPDFDLLLGQWHDADAASAQLALDLQEQEWTAEELTGGKKLLKAWRNRERGLWEAVAP